MWSNKLSSNINLNDKIIIWNYVWSSVLPPKTFFIIVLLDDFFKEVESLGIPLCFLFPLGAFKPADCIHNEAKEIEAKLLNDYLHDEKRDYIDLHVYIDCDAHLSFIDTFRDVLQYHVLIIDLDTLAVRLWSVV